MTDDKLAEIEAHAKDKRLRLQPGETLRSFGGYCGELLEIAHEDRATLLGMVEALRADISKWRRSFDGHVYVKNEEYETLRRERDEARASEARLREAAEAAKPMMQAAFLWAKSPPAESEVEHYREAYWNLAAAIAPRIAAPKARGAKGEG